MSGPVRVAAAEVVLQQPEFESGIATRVAFGRSRQSLQRLGIPAARDVLSGPGK